MSNQLAKSANQSPKEPILRGAGLPDSKPAQPGPLYKPYADEPAAAEPYRPYAEKPALAEPPYEPYKGI
jgi:hypothetical protein